MIQFSIKQLLRARGKVILGVLLLAGVTMLLIYSSVLLLETSQKLTAAEEQFTTIGTVEQIPDKIKKKNYYHECIGNTSHIYEEYNSLLRAEDLLFEGADYIVSPETRPYYLARLSETDVWTLRMSQSWFDNIYVLEFSPLEPSGGRAEVRVEEVLYARRSPLMDDAIPPVTYGDTVMICQHFTETPTALTPEKRYMGTFVYQFCRAHKQYEFVLYQSPFTSQYQPDGSPVETDMPVGYSIWREGDHMLSRSRAYHPHPYPDDPTLRIEEVTSDFNSPQGRRNAWSWWGYSYRDQMNWYYVMPTNSLELLPSFHNGGAYISQGRAITEEEFETGAKVCLVPDTLANFTYEANPAVSSLIHVGDKINFAMFCSLYGYSPDNEEGAYSKYVNVSNAPFQRQYSPLTPDGYLYSNFSVDVYEVVGVYRTSDRQALASKDSELARDLFFIPAKSVADSDENHIVYYGPMNHSSTSFQIPNGSMEEFDKKLHEAVPEADRLEIRYDDGGYSNAIRSLTSTRRMSQMLFIVGICGAVVIIIFLLYFFVVREKKRTAIERSLGMTKRQCRLSILSGLMLIVLIAVLLGSSFATLTLSWGSVPATEPSNQEQEKLLESQEYMGFSTEFSPWTQNLNSENLIVLDEGEVLAQRAVFIIVPLLILLLTGALSIGIVNRNLAVEPILLLGGDK